MFVCVLFLFVCPFVSLCVWLCVVYICRSTASLIEVIVVYPARGCAAVCACMSIRIYVCL